MNYDFNRLERSAKKKMGEGRYGDSLAIYFYMADGDDTLDAGWLGMKIAEYYEALGDLHAARYWHGRAVEENPGVWVTSEAARGRLVSLSIDDLLISE